MIAADPIYTLESIVPNAGTESSMTQLSGHVLIGVAVPAAITSTTAELQTSADAGATWLPIYDREGNKYTLALGASRYIALPPGDIAGLHNVRLKVGSSEAAARTFTLLLRKLG
jgi:hypothetical protein